MYPSVSDDVEGMKKLFRQFSFPGGTPSHVAPETPGSIRDGEDPGCALSHAFGVGFDNPCLTGHRTKRSNHSTAQRPF
jgi:xylulose-5-phosphate/fructose-6-phosphate phosphoketolase